MHRSLFHNEASCTCRGWFYLCFGRWCGLWTGPLRRYAQAFAAQRFLPDLAIQNHMNHEAILQVRAILIATFWL